ncbi:hypothetical protein LNQ49_21580 [Flavobacterium sp. F-65]|uniref:DUF2157 domain-containing protein n=1 Tax=Flavobacterium pisciphilum TaxID=2893755 RepID=A0ABS8MZI0_9FLAO|nr:hypothetical protein [Flavobacterium sp. F-65]MCC9074185.1 hypothetical protein [Flavobacterium sp. F-65]
MSIHDKRLLENLSLLKEADSLQSAGFISKEQYNSMKKELPSFKIHHNILVRIGFFLLGAFLYLSICGVIALMGFTTSNSDFGYVCCYIFAIVGFAGSEFLVRNNYYRHGLDDAFILGTILNAGFAIAISGRGDNILVIAITVTIISLIMYLRYLHLLSAFVFYVALTVTLGCGIFDYLEAGQAILPFFMMLFSIGTFFFCKKLLENLTESFHYNGILLIKSASLILLYLSGNYLVVREFSASLLGGYYEVSPEIPFPLFFWSFTFIIPVLYLFFALRNKDRIMLWISFLAIAFSFYSFRFYYSVLPIEVALTIGGLVLFAVAFFSIKKIKNNETGLTFKPDRISNSNSLLNAEALIIASTFGMKPEIKPEASPMEFGGGDFSGGGSGGSF